MLRSYPSVIQEGVSDCGACSLLMIIRHYNSDYSLERLRELTKTTSAGTTAYHLVLAAKAIGFNAWTVKGKETELTAEMLPCIAHVITKEAYSHFVVINKKSGRRLIISDPAIGIKTISLDDFAKITTGNYILFSLNKRLETPITKKAINEKILEFVLNNKRTIVFIFASSLVYTLISIFLTYRLQLFIELVISKYSNANLKVITLIILVLAIMKTLSDETRLKLINYLKHELDYYLMEDVYSHIIKLPYLYYKNRSSGEIISRLQDLGEIKEAIGQVFISLLIDLVLVLLAIIILIRINLYLSIILIIASILIIVLNQLFKPLRQYYLSSSKEKLAKMNNFLYESINSVDTVKGLALEMQMENAFKKNYQTLLNDSYKLNSIYVKENTIKEIIYEVLIAVILFVAVKLIFKGDLKLVQLITYISLLAYFIEPIKGLVQLSLSYSSIKLSIARINNLYEVKAEDLEAKNHLELSDHSIKIKDLTYSYDGINNILNKLNLSIKAGEKVLIMGKSGSGKSTLFKLLMRYFGDEESSIYLGKKRLDLYDKVSIRENIVYVSQNEIIYSDSLYNNVTLGRFIKYEDFLEIAKLSHIDELGGLAKYNMQIEENGFNLSGGERQRIMLARALVARAKIYVFDESLSQIDLELEREILSSIFKKYKGITFIVISHRNTNEDLFNKTYRLKEGKLKCLS